MSPIAFAPLVASSIVECLKNVPPATRPTERLLMSHVTSAPELSIVTRDSIPLAGDSGGDDLLTCVQSGETVVVLGAVADLLLQRLALQVGPTGKMIYVAGEDVGHHKPPHCENLELRRGLPCDLRLDLELLDLELARRPVQTAADWLELRAVEDRLRAERPLIADGGVDCVIAVGALNRLLPAEQDQFFREVFRALRVGGRAVVSDLVSDEDFGNGLRDDPALRRENIAGALREDRLPRSFEAAGFHGMEIQHRDVSPVRTVEGIEFRSLTISAWKGKQGICLERKQAVIYAGPFKQVEDDDGHVFPRGERIAVCDKTFRLLGRAPYTGQFLPVEPQVPVPLDQAGPFDCTRSVHRQPSETKGGQQPSTIGLSIVSLGGDCCSSGQCC